MKKLIVCGSGMRTRLVAICVVMLGLAACSKDAGPSKASGGEPQAGSENQPTQVLELDESDLQRLNKPWMGDFDEIAKGKRPFIRALVPISKTMYFLDGPEQRGIAFDSLREFEKVLGAKVGKGAIKPKIAIIPTTRDRLLPALAEGYGDLAIGALTITASRKEKVDFSEPTITGINQILVTGPSAPAIATLDDLAGKEVHVRRSSSYYESLVALNKRFSREGKPAVAIKPAEEVFEDEDLLEMVDAGIIPATVVDSYVAKFWVQIYDHLQVHNDVVLESNGELAWAIRRGAPKFRKVVNDFVHTHKVGTMFGNMMVKRYLGSAERLRNPTTEAEQRKLRTLAAHFKKYGGQYALDWLLVAAQGYQESRLDQGVKSRVGAVGVMQVKPDTAGDMGIKNINDAENNIHAGTKYLRFMIDHYYQDAPMDELNKGLFAIASYNAGPARITRLRAKTKSIGLNPNIWFRNVEIVAARDIGRETVDYVANIFKYYTAFKLINTHTTRKAASSGG